MNYDALVSIAKESFEPARVFQSIYPHAEHAIVRANRDFDSEGWKPVYEWIARAQLYDRYAIWLVLAVNLRDGAISAIEQPDLYLAEVENVSASGRYEVRVAQFEDGGWDEFVEAQGDFARLEIELRMNSPVEGFADFWRKSDPRAHASASDGISLRAPFRYMS